jgi:cation transport ATPase
VKTRSITLPIGGRRCCGAGARAIERTVAQIAGVLFVEANAATGTAYIEYDPALADLKQIRVAIKASGFGPARPAAPRPPHQEREVFPMQDIRRLRRAYLGGAVLVWVLIIAVTSLTLRGTPYFGPMLPVVGAGAVYFVVLVPGFLFRGR